VVFKNYWFIYYGLPNHLFLKQAEGYVKALEQSTSRALEQERGF
jgi:hypothetical protein